MGRVLSLLLWTALVLSAATAAARTRVELITVGPGDELYTRFGHTALLVSRDGAALAVYNYGLSDFDRPGLIWEFLRGGSTFWVARQHLSSMVADYRDEDRAVWRQPLNLSGEQVSRLLRILAHDALPANREYIYRHVSDNCATRPRDRLDRITGGAVARALKGAPSGLTWRDLIRQGFASSTTILLASEFLVGRRVDDPVDRWQASALPTNLSRYLQQVKLPGGRVLALPPTVINARRGGDPLADDPLAAVKLLWALAALACLLAPATILLARRRSRWAGLSLLLQAAPMGLCGLLCWGLCAVASLPELRQNELVLALWPTDLLLLVVAWRWLRGRWTAGRLLRVYATVRLVSVAALLLGHATGLLYQQPRAMIVMAAALAVGLWGAVCWGRKEELTANGSTRASPLRPDTPGAG